MQVIAHRGASGYAPEHTLAAYELALAQGAEVLELDVRGTRDGELVVLHDKTLLRTTGDPRRIAAVTLAELAPGARPLTLDDVLERYGRRAQLLVEVKDPAPPWEEGVAAAIARHGLAGRAIVQSFDRVGLRRMRVAAPWLEVAALCGRGPATSRGLRSMARYASGIGVWHGAVTAPLVLRAHAAGLTVRAWTVNAPAEMRRLRALGVDGLITDVPDVGRSIAGEKAAAPVAARAA